MKKKPREIVCDNCGQAHARIRKVPRTYGKGANLLVIENVPVVSCPQCGQSYLTADVLHEIERIKQCRSGRATERTVEVASFA
jgi:YgiT-type zinc finger domain-containing protein